MESGINPTDLHLQKVWAQIERMTCGQKIIVSAVAPKFPKLWIKCACMWMDCFGFHTIQFNHDYSILTCLTTPKDI